jgi:hypothetical protein
VRDVVKNGFTSAKDAEAAALALPSCEEHHRDGRHASGDEHRLPVEEVFKHLIRLLRMCEHWCQAASRRAIHWRNAVRMPGTFSTRAIPAREATHGP